MKALLLMLVVLTSIGSCDHLKVIEGTSQKWVGGVPNPPRGVTYNLSLIALRNSTELKVDQLWVNDEYYRVNGVKKLPALPVDGFEVNDTIYIVATKVDGSERAMENQPQKRPEGFDEEWIVGYQINGKRKYLGTNAVKVLKSMSKP